MLGKLAKWASLVKAAEAPTKVAEASTKSPDQKAPPARVMEKAAPLQTSANTSLEPMPKPVEMTKSSAGSSEPAETRLSAEVKFYREDKNHGFLLIPDAEKDLLIHRNGIVDGTVPQKGAVYWYEIGMDQQKRPCAVNASLRKAAQPARTTASNHDTKELLDWAFIPGFTRDSNSKGISDLATLALKEDWRYRERSDEDFDEFGILRNYVKQDLPR